MNFRRRPREHSEVETGALSDILFFLLMFFLMISTLASPDAIKLLLPESSTAQNTPKEVIRMTVDENKNYFIDDNPVKFEELENTLAAQVKEKNAETLVLRIDKTKTVQDLTDIYDIAARLNLSMVMAADKKRN